MLAAAIAVETLHRHGRPALTYPPPPFATGDDVQVLEGGVVVNMSDVLPRKYRVDPNETHSGHGRVTSVDGPKVTVEIEIAIGEEWARPPQ